MSDHAVELLRDLHAEVDYLAQAMDETERRYERLDLLVRSMQWEAFALAVMAAATGDRLAFARAEAMNRAAERVAQVLRP